MLKNLLPARVTEVFSAREDATLTLDAMWREALAFPEARVEIESKAIFSDQAKVSIKFKRAGGTTIDAVGRHEDVYVAFDRALKEARVLVGR